jgi:hypothetical protein
VLEKKTRPVGDPSGRMLLVLLATSASAGWSQPSPHAGGSTANQPILPSQSEWPPVQHSSPQPGVNIAPLFGPLNFPPLVLPPDWGVFHTGTPDSKSSNSSSSSSLSSPPLFKFSGGLLPGSPLAPLDFKGGFLAGLNAPQRPAPKEVETWQGPRPEDTGAYADGFPQKLLILAIEDYQARGDVRPNHKDVLKCAQDIQETWRTSGKGPLNEHPVPVTFLDGQVTPEIFVGPSPVCSRYDLVLFMGHSSPEGPWLGEGERSALMRTSNYHWSGGTTKCLGTLWRRPSRVCLGRGERGRNHKAGHRLLR